MGNEKPPDAAGRRPRRPRASLNDVAELAGVGIATVDRVLNERGGVSPKTARKIIDAARQLDLRRVLPVPYRRGLRLDVLMLGPGTPFFARLNEAFIRVAATLDRSVIVQRSFIDEARPRQTAERILATRAHGLIFCGQETPAVVEAVSSVTSAGIPVVTVVSDLPTSPRLAYVGADHYGSGRTAAFFMVRMARGRGPVIVLCRSFGFRAHAERVSGFRDGLRDHDPGLRVACTLEGHDEHVLSEKLVADALARFPDCIGIYNAGSANRAVELPLKAQGIAGRVFIGHGLDVDTRRLLAEGVMTLAMDQNPEQQARAAIDVLLKRFGLSRSRGGADGDSGGALLSGEPETPAGRGVRH